MPTREHIRRTNVRPAAQGDSVTACDREARRLRESLILEYLPMVRRIAGRIHLRLPGHVCLADLTSAGVVGLIQAIDNFDPSQGAALRTYAAWRIRGSILDSLRELDWAPQLRRRQAKEFERAAAHLEQKLHRAPEESEIAAEVKLTIGEYRQRLTKVEGLTAARPAQSGHDRSPAILKCPSPQESQEAMLQRVELNRQLHSAIWKLPDSERKVIWLCFYEQMRIREVSRVLGIGTERVSWIKCAAIRRLRISMLKHKGSGKTSLRRSAAA